MNNRTPHTSDFDSLDALFSTARQMQPNLMDDNFTKRLLNDLPTVNLVERKKIAKKGLSFDLIGAVIGLLMAYLFIDRSFLQNSFLSLASDSIVVSPMLIITVIGAIGLSSAVAWWAVEDNRL